MGKIFLFVSVVIIGFLGLLFFANKNDETKTAIIIPTAIPTSIPATIIPTNTITSSIPTPTVATISAEQFISDMASKSAVIKTTKGDITMSFYTSDSPNTVFNFIKKASSGFYNNLLFHRVEDWVVQGGDPKGDGTGGGNMPVEFNDKPFVEGSVGVASKGDGKVQNDAQFFIAKQDASWLNGKYTNFGIVTKGMDVVKKMEIGDKILGITIQ